MTIVAKFGPESGGGSAGIAVEDLIYSDTDNKVVGPLGATPTSIDESLSWFGGVSQNYTKDFTLRLVTGGASPGWYMAISTTSTAPGGGSFSGGSNPATGLAEAELNDIFQLLYKTV